MRFLPTNSKQPLAPSLDGSPIASRPHERKDGQCSRPRSFFVTVESRPTPVTALPVLKKPKTLRSICRRAKPQRQQCQTSRFERPLLRITPTAPRKLTSEN